MPVESAPVDVLVGPLAALGLVLVVSGVLKLVDTAPTEAMFGALSLPRSALAVRAVALFEIVVGVGAAVLGGRVAAALVAVAYAGFAVVSLVLVRRGERSVSCGCFGRSSATISPIHVVVDGVAALVAAAAAVAGAPGWFDVWSEQPGAGVPGLLLVVIVAALTIAVLTVLPDTLQAARRQPADATGASGVRQFSLTVGEP